MSAQDQAEATVQDRVSKEKDLGILTDEHLEFGDNITEKVKKGKPKHRTDQEVFLSPGYTYVPLSFQEHGTSTSGIWAVNMVTLKKKGQ